MFISIDEYEVANNLRGAVRDGLMESFLLNPLNVLEGKVMNLCSGGATWKVIADAFSSLCQNECIRQDDPILLCFASQDREMPRPDKWGDELKEDRGIFVHNVQPHELTDRTTFPIPNRNIISWLDKLSNEKGDNIARPHNSFRPVPRSDVKLYCRRLCLILVVALVRKRAHTFKESRKAFCQAWTTWLTVSTMR